MEDLAFRKIFLLFKAFRYEEGKIKKNSRIAAMLRRPEDKDVFMKTLRSEVKKIDGVDIEKWDELLTCIEVVDAKSSDGRYKSLEKWFDHSKKEGEGILFSYSILCFWRYSKIIRPVKFNNT